MTGFILSVILTAIPFWIVMQVAVVVRMAFLRDKVGMRAHFSTPIR
jgi:hypothetical protein